MKNLLLVTLSVTLGWASLAQSPYKTFNHNPASMNKSRLATPRKVVDPAVVPSVNPVNAAQKSQSSPAQSFQLTETVIGTTTYDLQSNSAVANRIVYNTDGTVQTAWTYSNTFDLAAADRGTGYNFNNGTSFGPAPTSSIEGGIRTGWGELITLGNGTEVVISHAPALNNLVMSKRNPYGSGTWDVAPLSDIYPAALWPRAAAAGPDGNTIHVVAHDENTASLGGKLFYSRSLNGGTTWDIAAIEVPGIDATNYRMISGDSYAIHARGNYVAVVYFGGFERTVIAKSNDNGSTWTSKQVFDLPYMYDYTSINATGTEVGISDVNGDGVGDTIYTTDGYGTVIIDAGGTAHVFWGVSRQIDDTLEAQGFHSTFPLVSGIGYWNENMRTILGTEEPQIIANSFDLDNSGSVYDDHVILGGSIDFADYSSGPTTMPNAGIDSNGCFYLVYTGAIETLNSGSQYYRHIYAIRSCDGGCTWSYPIDLTNTADYDFLECVFPSMAHTVGAKFHLLFQRDAEPGLAVRGDEDAFVLNDIVYIKEDAIRLDTIPYGCVGTIMLPYSTFCNGDSVLLTASCGTAWAWSTGETTKTIYAKTFGAVSCDITTACGYNVTDMVTLNAVSAGPSITLSATSTQICAGSPATVSTSNVPGGTWVWSTGGNTQSITVNTPGTYMVTVSNCGGSTNDSITISGFPAPVAGITPFGPTTFCYGGSVPLNASGAGTGGSYKWSTGQTTSVITVNTSGSYSVTAYNTCGDSSVSNPVTVTVNPPVPTVSAGGPTEFCSGTSVTLTSTSANSYSWSNGDTTQSITVTASGNYVVTVSDGTCTAPSSATVVTVNSSPSATITPAGPTTFCQGGSVVLSGNVGTTYAWSTNATTASITVTQTGTYSVTITDAGGCTGTANNSITVAVNPLPAVPTVSSALDANGNFTFTSNASSGNQWQNNGTAIAGETNATYTVSWQNIEGDSISVVVTDNNGCSSESAPIVAVPASVQNTEIRTTSVTAYPNPNNGQFTVGFVNVVSDNFTVNVRNIIGQTVFSKKLNIEGNYKMFIDLSKFNAGMYFLTIANSQGEQTQKVIVK